MKPSPIAKFQILLLTSMLLLLLMSCHNASNTAGSGNVDTTANSLQNKAFLFGPSVDTATFTVETHCDCCTSHLTLFRDNTFGFISYCLEGDTYTKGKFSLRDKELFLDFDSIQVIQSFGFVADTSYAISKVAPRKDTLRITDVRNRILLLYNGGGITEYGVEESSVNVQAIAARFKQDSINHYLGGMPGG